MPISAQTNNNVNFPNDTLQYKNSVYGIDVAYPSTWKVEEKDFRGGDYATNIVSFLHPIEAKKDLKSIVGMQAITFGIIHRAMTPRATMKSRAGPQPDSVWRRS